MSACGQQPASQGSDNTAPASKDETASSASQDEASWCGTDAAQGSANTTVSVSLFDRYHAGTDAQVKELQDYFDNVGIAIQPKPSGRMPEANYVFDYSEDEMADDVIATYGNDPTQAQVLEIVFKHMFKTVIAFAKQAHDGEVSIAFVQSIEAPRVSARKSGNKVTLGVGFSDKLIQEGINADANIYELLHDAIGGAIPPMLFVGMADVASYASQSRYVIAHELGHALTLPHVQDRNNLMYPQALPLSCVPTITLAQVKTITDASAHTARAAREVETSEPWADALSALTRQVLSRVKQ